MQKYVNVSEIQNSEAVLERLKTVYGCECRIIPNSDPPIVVLKNMSSDASHYLNDNKKNNTPVTSKIESIYPSSNKLRLLDPHRFQTNQKVKLHPSLVPLFQLSSFVTFLENFCQIKFQCHFNGDSNHVSTTSEAVGHIEFMNGAAVYASENHCDGKEALEKLYSAKKSGHLPFHDSLLSDIARSCAPQALVVLWKLVEYKNGFPANQSSDSKKRSDYALTPINMDRPNATNSAQSKQPCKENGNNATTSQTASQANVQTGLISKISVIASEKKPPENDYSTNKTQNNKRSAHRASSADVSTSNFRKPLENDGQWFAEDLDDLTRSPAEVITSSNSHIHSVSSDFVNSIHYPTTVKGSPKRHSPPTSVAFTDLTKGPVEGKTSSLFPFPQHIRKVPSSPILQRKPHIPDQRRRRPVIIDGQNVGYMMKANVFSADAVVKAVAYFQERGHDHITVIIPKWAEKFAELHNLYQANLLRYVPQRVINNQLQESPDDLCIIQTAMEVDGVILSNDQFRKETAANPKFKTFVEERLLMFYFSGPKLIIPEEVHGPNNPKLSEILCFPEEKPSTAPVNGLTASSNASRHLIPANNIPLRQNLVKYAKYN